MLMFPTRMLRRFRDSEAGNATIEFVFLFPIFIFLFLTGFESGYYMVRSVMLERALDISIREVRLSNGTVPSYTELKDRICAQAMILPDCSDSLQVELRQVTPTPGGIAVMNAGALCVNRNWDASVNREDETAYETSGENQLIAVRICALMEPLFPSTGIGAGMARYGDGEYALVASTAFVSEPGNRAINPSSSTTTGGSSDDGS